MYTRKATPGHVTDPRGIMLTFCSISAKALINGVEHYISDSALILDVIYNLLLRWGLYGCAL